MFRLALHENPALDLICGLLRHEHPRYDLAAVDWQSVVELSSQHLVTCHIGHILLRHPQALPLEPREYFSNLVERNRERNRRALDHARDLARRLDTAGIPSCVLKGMANVAAGLYPDDGARIVADTDVLTRPEDRPGCVRILEDLGYEPHDPSGYYRDNPDHHHGPPWLHPEREIGVELHSRVMPRQYDSLLDVDSAFEHSMKIPGNDVGLRVMTPTWRMLHLVAHTQLSNGYLEKDLFELRPLVDAHLLIRTHGADIDWRLIKHRFRDAGYEHALNAFLIALRATLEDPVPAATRLRPGDQWRWTRVRARLGNPRIWKLMRHAERVSKLPGRLMQPGWYAAKWRFLRLSRRERERILHGGEIRTFHRRKRSFGNRS